MKRGDVVIVVSPGEYGKPRPAIIVQTDVLNPTHDSVIVCPLTTDLLNAPLARVAIRPSSTNGVERPSEVMVDKITVVHHKRIKRHVGVADDATMLAVDRALSFVLAMD